MHSTYIFVCSDLHMGSEECKADIILQTLKSHTYDILLGVGDLAESDNLNEDQWKLLRYLQENREKIVYVDGNHDPRNQENIVNRTLDIPILDRYEFTLGGKKFVAMHGHQFDGYGYLFAWRAIDKLFSFVIKCLKKVHLVKKQIDYHHRQFSSQIARRAIKYAKKKGYDVIICGHTHHARRIKKGKVLYLNCGCFTESCSYITIDHAGNIGVHKIIPNTS